MTEASEVIEVSAAGTLVCIMRSRTLLAASPESDPLTEARAEVGVTWSDAHSKPFLTSALEDNFSASPDARQIATGFLARWLSLTISLIPTF